jgi:hypothetical protein
MKAGFIGRFFSLIVRFFAHFGIEFGFDYSVRPGCLYQLLRRYFDRAVHEFRDVVDDDP